MTVQCNCEGPSAAYPDGLTCEYCQQKLDGAAVEELIADTRVRMEAARRERELAEEREHLARESKVRFAFEQRLQEIKDLVPQALLPYLQINESPSDRDLELQWTPTRFQIKDAPGLGTISFHIFEAGSACDFDVLNHWEGTSYYFYQDWDSAIIHAAAQYDQYKKYDEAASKPEQTPIPRKPQTPAEQLWELIREIARDEIESNQY